MESILSEAGGQIHVDRHFRPRPTYGWISPQPPDPGTLIRRGRKPQLMQVAYLPDPEA
ncbi:MAG: hypothetical protein WKF57_17600 [Nakamurella sp.]